MNNNIIILKAWLENNGFEKEASLLSSIIKEGQTRWEQKYTFEGADAKNMYIALEKLSVNDWRQILSILDPTGTLSIPDVPPAVAAFESNKSLFNSILLILAVLAVLPVAGKLAKLGSKGLKTVSAALLKAKKVVPSNFGAKADEALRIIENLGDVTQGVSPMQMTRSMANMVRQSVQKVKNMKFGTTSILDRDLYVFISAHSDTAKVNSGFIAPGRTSERMATMGDHVAKGEEILEKLRPPNAVGRIDTVYVSPWSDTGAWEMMGPDVFLARIPKGSKITYLDGDHIAEVVMNAGSKEWRSYGSPDRARSFARSYWAGESLHGRAGGEILTKAKVEVLGTVDDVLSKEIISGTASPPMFDW